MTFKTIPRILVSVTVNIGVGLNPLIKLVPARALIWIMKKKNKLDAKMNVSLEAMLVSPAACPKCLYHHVHGYCSTENNHHHSNENIQ